MLYLLLFVLTVLLIKQIKTSTKYLHIMQLEGYKGNQYARWMGKNINITKSYKVEWIFILLAAVIFLITPFVLTTSSIFKVFLGIYIFFILITVTTEKKVEQKKKMVFTNRLIRLFIVVLIVTTLENILIFYWAWGYVQNETIIQYNETVIGLLALIALMPFNILIANTINYPIEYLIQMRYKLSARKRAKNLKSLKIIGITGSFGKTSTKNFVNVILSEKYNVLMTPASFNTPMGLCKVIRGDLNEANDVFIAEMGARYVGDIKELCNIVRPNIGIITSIGPQHLETFKTIDKIKNTKFEIIDALPKEGLAILNADDEQSMKGIGRVRTRLLTYGIENDADLKASNIKTSGLGTGFIINDKNGNEIECTTKLLGKHNVYNILAAVCAAVELGLNFKQIKSGIAKIQPVEHRLQIIPTNNGITVIDDAFNSNPVGSKMALDVISEISGGSKIIITPGMVELGKEEYNLNKEFGKHIAKTCDFAILVGPKRSEPIVAGLREAGFAEEKIIITKNLNEATGKIGLFAKLGDIVLFENDLPDNYNE